MHEVSLMENALEIALNYAQQQGAKQIHRLKLRVGEQSGVVPEALAFAFDIVVKGTIAETAKLELETVPARCYCSHCNCLFSPVDLFYQCPQCQQYSTDVLEGKELELASLEIS